MARITIVVEDSESDPQVFTVKADFSRSVPEKPEDLTPAEAAAFLVLHTLRNPGWEGDDATGAAK